LIDIERLALIHALARIGIAFTWAWHGLIPKLLFVSPDEQAMLVAFGLPVTILPAIGILQLAVAIATIVLWRWRPFFLLNALVMAVVLIGIALRSPSYIGAAFTPVTLNAGMIFLSIIGYCASGSRPRYTTP
jgi:hypothetical protein